MAARSQSRLPLSARAAGRDNLALDQAELLVVGQKALGRRIPRGRATLPTGLVEAALHAAALDERGQHRVQNVACGLCCCQGYRGESLVRRFARRKKWYSIRGVFVNVRAMRL